MPNIPENSALPVRTFTSFWKLVIIGFIILVLMIPVAWISSLIHERYNRSNSVVEEIASKWGASQLISGPFISVPYYTKVIQSDAKGMNQSETITHYLHISPDTMSVTGKVESVIHNRSIFKVTGYTTNLLINCTIPSMLETEILPEGIVPDWKNALVTFDLKDDKGLKELTGSINGQPLNFKKSDNVLMLAPVNEPESLSGRDKIMYKPEVESDRAINFKFEAKTKLPNPAQAQIVLNLSLTGTQQLSFLPSALKETISLSGDWASPSFNGDILPEKREVTNNGFTSSWQTNYLNSGNKPFWTSEDPNLRLSVLGVSFLVPVDAYQQTTRTIKYSILFLLLTFMTFFFAETMSQQRIHPIQYLMVGSSLVIFYLLLLSLSEHISFGWSYLIASAGVILQITLYCYTILRTHKFALQTGGILTALYVFLYILLQLEDSALLICSISLFVLLGIAMYIIRNVKWYNQE